MSWTIMEKKRKEGERNTSEFMEALMMVKEGTEILCELAEEMEELYGEKWLYGQQKIWPQRR